MFIKKLFQFGLNIFESYYNIEVNTQVLSQLPDNGTVIDCITAEEIDKPHSNSNVGTEVDADTDDEEPSPIVTTVPNLLPEQQELEQLQQHLQQSQNPILNAGIPYLSMPSFQSTPLSEFNRSQLLLSLAFPTLYPYGEAEFCHPRLRDVSYIEYIEHFLKY